MDNTNQTNETIEETVAAEAVAETEEVIIVPEGIDPFLANRCEVCGAWYSKKAGSCPNCGDPKELVIDDWIGYIIVCLSCLLTALAAVQPLVSTVALIGAVIAVVVSILVIIVSYVRPGESKQWPMLLISMSSLIAAYLISINAVGR